MTLWIGIAVWMGALALVLMLVGGVRRGDRMHRYVQDARSTRKVRTEPAELEGRPLGTRTAAKTSAGRETRRATA